jgi:hypothetical protein
LEESRYVAKFQKQGFALSIYGAIAVILGSSGVAWAIDDKPVALEEKCSPSTTPVTVDRSIGIDFFVMSPTGTPVPVTSADIKEAVDMANMIFTDADISFYVASENYINTGYLHDIRGTNNVSWNEICFDASFIGLDPDAFPSAHATKIPEWLNQIAAQLSPTRIPVFVGMAPNWGSNCASPSPWDDGYDNGNNSPSGAGWSEDRSHGIICKNDGRGILALAHELGHYLGRIFGWLNKSLELSKDYEYLTEPSVALIQIAMIRIMAHRMALEG